MPDRSLLVAEISRTDAATCVVEALRLLTVCSWFAGGRRDLGRDREQLKARLADLADDALDLADHRR